MAAYAVVSASVDKFRVDLGDCGEKHALSVLDQLLVEPTVPSDLELEQTGQPRRSLVARILGR